MSDRKRSREEGDDDHSRKRSKTSSSSSSTSSSSSRSSSSSSRSSSSRSKHSSSSSSSSSSRDKEKSRSRDKEKSSRDKGRSSKERERSSRERDDKDKDRRREKERDGKSHRESSKDKYREKDRERERDKHRDNDKERRRDKERDERDRDRNRDADLHGDRDRKKEKDRSADRESSGSAGSIGDGERERKEPSHKDRAGDEKSRNGREKSQENAPGASREGSDSTAPKKEDLGDTGNFSAAVIPSAPCNVTTSSLLGGSSAPLTLKVGLPVSKAAKKGGLGGLSVDPKKAALKQRKQKLLLWKMKMAAQKELEEANPKVELTKIEKGAAAAAVVGTAPTQTEELESEEEEDTIMREVAEVEDNTNGLVNENDKISADADGIQNSLPNSQVVAKEATPSKPAPEEEDDEIDPLDAFMVGITEEVQKLNPVKIESVKEKGGSVQRVKRKKAAKTGDDVSGMGERYYSDEELGIKSDDEVQGGYNSEEEDALYAALVGRKKHVFEKVDHDKVDYIPIRKNFYVEVPEIASMSDEEAARLRKEELDDIRIKGKDCPKPIKFFHQCGLTAKIMSVCKKLNYEKPTPIQAQAIPAIMSGRDVIGIAKTGSGKTLAFLLPLLRHIFDQPPLRQGEGMIGLVMAPSRELALQIHSEAKKFCKKLGMRSACIYGGVGVPQQIGELKRGAEVIVATPGRLIDILATNCGKVTNLKRCSFLVLDEADRMFDMGFEPQIMKIIDNIRPDRQTVLFSATFPRSVESAARKILKRPLEVLVGARSVVCDDVTQLVEVREKDSRFKRLLELLGVWVDKGRILVFVDTQKTCDLLWEELSKAGYKGLPLHGGVDQSDRHSFIEQFKKGEVDLLVATSVAARGLDVKNLKLVVNFDCPNHLEDYVHRAGRTGRAGAKGTAVTFITPEQSMYAPDLVKALKDSKQEIPEDLQQLADAQMKAKKEGTAKMHGSGFGGRGFKFDEEEESKRNSAIKQQKIAYGVVDEADDDDDDKKSEESTEKAIEREAKALGVTREELRQAAERYMDPSAMKDNEDSDESSSPSTTTSTPVPVVQPSLSGSDAARSAFEQIKANSGSTGKTRIDIEAAKRKAKLFAMAVNMNMSKGSGTDMKVNEFHRELEINDYPQQARWKVTHKDALAHITEWTGCAVTVKGVFYPPGKQPKQGDEPKLFLFIEGASEESVSSARSEIKRILIDASALAHPERTGKYSVT